jgi:penicillin G amidase
MRVKRFLFILVIGLILITGLVVSLLIISLPTTDGNIRLPGLSSSVAVHSDERGNPSIVAENRIDAYRTLGYLHARDRLFQMELMRRKSSGRLAELFGISAVEIDRKQRSYQFSKTARQIVSDLPAEQYQVLHAYVSGVNAYIEQTTVFPPEFLALQHQPEPWREEDSILVILGMFQTLNGQEQDERMLTVMEKVLPVDMVKFLTPDTDIYTSTLLGGSAPRRFMDHISSETFINLADPVDYIAHNHVDSENIVAGSNNWVVAGSKTADGRAIVANDMHLGLSVPNIWYRADLRYQQHIYGVTLPGVPAVIVGSNDQVAWGFTNVTADLIDLIRLELNPDNPQQYRTVQGWVEFKTHQEIIRIKDAPSVDLTIQGTIWGPVSLQPLLSEKVAVKWTALERHAVDLGLLAMDQASTTEQAMDTMNHIGAPPQNVVIADREGHIGWTYMGRFPNRISFDGLTSRSWADGNFDWQGFLSPEDLPRLLDPPEGFIATANNRTLGSEYPHVIGHNWSLGYRAFRIAELLREQDNLTERELLAIQLDTRSEVYDFYQQLALNELQAIPRKDKALQEVEQVLKAWDGHMSSSSIGASLLAEFRRQLAEEMFAKVVAAGQTLDPNFKYAWREMETPMRILLSERPKGLLRAHLNDNWNTLIIDTLRQSAQQLQRDHPTIKLTQLTWGETHPITVRHTFSKLSPLLAQLLDMPTFASDGCASFCVKVMGRNHSASERLVLSPLHPEDAIFHMPGGQSGHPLSEHYRDQQNSWQLGIATAFQLDKSAHTLQFSPDAK